MPGACPGPDTAAAPCRLPLDPVPPSGVEASGTEAPLHFEVLFNGAHDGHRGTLSPGFSADALDRARGSSS